MTEPGRVDPRIRQRAKELRQPLTPAEQKLWSILRDRRLGGYKFRRQHPIGNYICDFYCADARLVIELDGSSHIGQEAYDAERTTWLEAMGNRVIRFRNDDVLYRTLEVVVEIERTCDEMCGGGAED